MCDLGPDRMGVVVGTDAAGVLILTPCGPLAEDISPSLLQLATTAVSVGVGTVAVDLRQVTSYDESGVHAVRCCRALAAGEVTIRFLTCGGISQELLLDSYHVEQLPTG